METTIPAETPARPSFKERLKELTRKKYVRVLLGVAALLIIGGVGYLLWNTFGISDAERKENALKRLPENPAAEAMTEEEKMNLLLTLPTGTEPTPEEKAQTLEAL